MRVPDTCFNYCGYHLNVVVRSYKKDFGILSYVGDGTEDASSGAHRENDHTGAYLLGRVNESKLNLVLEAEAEAQLPLATPFWSMIRCTVKLPARVESVGQRTPFSWQVVCLRSS